MADNRPFCEKGLSKTERKEILFELLKEFGTGTEEGYVEMIGDRAIDLTLAVKGEPFTNPHDLIERIEKIVKNYTFEDEMGECRIGGDPRFERLLEALKKEFSPSEPGQGVRGHSADARVASVKELDLPPESSGRGRTPRRD